MKYKITVKELTEIDGQKYPNDETIYEQVVEHLDVVAVINAVNESVKEPA